jgi:type II secretory pathway pseudopilin PulG
MPTGIALIVAALLAGLLATLVLAAFATPRQWWRRANARALAFVAAGTLGIAALLLWLAGEPPCLPKALLAGAPAVSHEADATTAAPPFAGRRYRVHDDLNLRSAGGVESPRMAVVPAGSTVVATGEQSGEWWRVRARVQGREFEGWASSLWLRRPDERR